MAIWEAYFTVLPTVPLQESRITVLDAVLPRIPHWSATAFSWGQVEGSRLEFWVEEGELCEGALRVDMRSPNEQFLHAVIKLLRDSACSLEDENANRIQADPIAIAAALKRSRAARFLNDSEAYLGRVAAGGWEDA